LAPTPERYAMKNVQAVCQPIMAALALLFVVAVMDDKSSALADTEPDFLVLNPERD